MFMVPDFAASAMLRLSAEDTAMESGFIPPFYSDLTDEDALKRLPPLAPVRDEYNRQRANGATPSAALRDTMALWRELQGGSAYVPHRRV